MLIYLELLQTHHLSQVLTLDQDCFGGLWTQDAYQREIDSPNSLILVLCNRENQQIIGFGCFWAILEEAHITLLAVHPQYQGQGWGQLLLYHLLDQARLWGLERATLEVKTSNQIARSIYEKFDFQIAGRRKGYYAKTGEDALIFWLNGIKKPEFAEKLALWHAKMQKRALAQQWTLVNTLEKKQNKTKLA